MPKNVLASLVESVFWYSYVASSSSQTHTSIYTHACTLTHTNLLTRTHTGALFCPSVLNKANLHFLRIIELNGGHPPLTYKRFQTLISRMDPPEMPVETLSGNLMGRCVTPISEDHGEKYGVPSLEELGENPNTPHQQIE